MAIAVLVSAALLWSSAFVYLAEAQSSNFGVACIQRCEHGRCIGRNTCLCDDGWGGASCNVALCNPDCGPYGACTSPNVCRCAPGWTGKFCKYPICQPSCQLHGTCIGPNQCSCFQGWFGENCQQANCTPSCLNGGACVLPDICSCPEQWSGARCEKPECVAGCVNGACQFDQVSQQVGCVCSPGWEGPSCDQPVCANVICQHGKCIANDTCFCDDGWTDKSCDKAICSTNCNGPANGFCREPEQCVCTPAFSGRDCAIHTSASCPANQPLTGDVLVAIDESGSIGFENFALSKEFAGQVVRVLANFSQVFIGVLKFGNGPSAQIPLQPASRISYADIAKIQYAEGASNGAELLKFLANASAWQSTDPNRLRVTRTVLIVTDGMWLGQNQAVTAAAALRDAGINIYVIAVGQVPTRGFLKNVATDSVNYYTEVDSFMALTQIKHNFLTKLCSDMACTQPCQNGGQCVAGQCQCKSLFSGYDCSQTICGPPRPVVNASFVQSDPLNARYNCRRGFSMIGPEVATCTPTGWSTLPVCKKVCDDPPPVENARWTKHMLSDDANTVFALYVCSQDHVVEGTDSQSVKVLCRDGFWEQRPTCNRAPLGMAQTCGNGVVDNSEQCDDGNRDSGDGCSTHCQIETPAGAPPVTVDRRPLSARVGASMHSNMGQPNCGNGVVEPGEQCDDGNTASNDGCDDDCNVEAQTTPASICGNGILEKGEECDSGNPRGGNGCNANCTKVKIQTISNPSAPGNGGLANVTGVTSSSSCLPILNVPFGQASVQSLTQTSAVVEVRCNDGYAFRGLPDASSVTITCANSVWDSSPVCDPAAATVSSDCLRCMCKAEGCSSGCRSEGNRWFCGPYSISFQYFQLCSPTGGDWLTCALDRQCAERCVKNFVNTYTPHCTRGRTPTCEDYVRVHKSQNIDGCLLRSAFLDAFVQRVQTC